MDFAPDEPAKSVDANCATLHELGWSCGDLAFDEGDGLIWQVFAHKGDQKILTRSSSQADAWSTAADQAEKLANG
jgi:hypothetical protein